MLKQIDKYADEKITFAFESTLSGRTYVDRIKEMKISGYKIVIFYVMLEDVEVNLGRIKERVSKGGHNIPEADARRRFPRSASNFLSVYSLLADEWQIFDNTLLHIRRVAEQNSNGIQVFDETLFNKLKQNAKR